MSVIPDQIADYTTDWFNAVLAPHLGVNSVIDSEVRPHELPGQTAEIISAKLSYQHPGDILPERLVIKATSQDPQIIELINTFDQYRRETAFYTRSADVSIPVPTCFHAAHDPESQRIVLVLEDLAPSESPAWAISPEQVETAIAHLPAFHARWWNDPTLETEDWLVQQTDRAFYGAAFGGAAAAIPVVKEHFGDAMGYSEEMATRLNEDLDTILSYVQTRHHTLVHGDYHGKQMFFPTAAGGRFAVIDWQFPFHAQGPWDLARMIALGLATPVRRERERGLMKGYAEGLRSSGITGYSEAELKDDFRMGLMISQVIMMIALADTDPAIIAAECESLGMDWKDLFLARTDACLKDHDALDLLRAIAS